MFYKKMTNNEKVSNVISLNVKQSIHLLVSTIKHIDWKPLQYIGWRWRHFNDFIYVYRC